jgi:aryl-alcohol dehydrogenase-like predicted oxidoreductase
VPMMESEQLGFVIWSPLAVGFLAGKYKREGAGDGRRASFDTSGGQGGRLCNHRRHAPDGKFARRVSCANSDWLLAQKVVTSVIIGARRIDQLDDNIASTKVTLSAEELTTLESVSALTPEYPAGSFAMQRANRADQRPGNRAMLKPTASG